MNWQSNNKIEEEKNSEKKGKKRRTKYKISNAIINI